MPNTEAFYETLKPHTDFAHMAEVASYTPIPEDWWIGTSDIVGSTLAIEQGKYKTVNMIGAAVISAQINAHGGQGFPFIFGGDGAGFAVPPTCKDRAADALVAVQAWAKDAFDMGLRVGLMRVSDIRSAGFEVSIARFQVADGVDYAMFSGGGLSWAENQMKAGASTLPPAPSGTLPDLTGLSCRWSHMPARNGSILSVVIMPDETVTNGVFSEFAKQVVTCARGLDRSGHPADSDGPGVRWPPKGARLEAHARRGAGSLRAAQRRALFESFIAWCLIKTGLTIGGFDARRYRRVVGDNADFRKFDDGLKMTLDCDPRTERDLRALLDRGAAEGIIRYGIHVQSEAMMTCIVPSILEDTHMHFVDGAAGGYTAAAKAIKRGGQS